MSSCFQGCPDGGGKFEEENTLVGENSTTPTKNIWKLYNFQFFILQNTL